MNYAYLGERLSQSAADNFPVLLADLCARADAAYITDSTRSLLENREPGEHEFPSSQALLDYATHRLLWSWYRRDRDRPVTDPTIPDASDEPQIDEAAAIPMTTPIHCKRRARQDFWISFVRSPVGPRAMVRAQHAASNSFQRSDRFVRVLDSLVVRCSLIR